MTSVPSATTWGSPTATKHALLIHGLTSSSHTWRRVASSLAAQGYFVTAPNLVGHAFRVSTDYRISSIAQDLRPYLEARNYSLIIGHSLGAVTALALSAHLPQSYPTAFILVDPPLQLSQETISFFNKSFTGICANPPLAEVNFATENPLWDREDAILRELGPRMCPVDTIHGLFEQNNPWHFLDLFNGMSEKWKVTVLIADPTIYAVCATEDLRPFPNVRPMIVKGAGHWIQNEFPDIVVEEAAKAAAELEIA